MKKQLFTLVIILSALVAVAQTDVPNGGFESWTGGKPDNWTTSINGNVIVTIPVMGDFPYPLSANFGSQVPVPHSGNYALKLQASSLGIPSTDYNITIPGVAQLGAAGEFNIPLSTITDLMNGGLDSINMDNIGDLATFLNLLASGMPCETTPYSLSMWVKYLPQGMDTMRVIAFTKQNGVPVSYAQMETDQTLPEYTQVFISFDSPQTACDSICIIILAGGMSTDLNTELYVDDIQVDFGVGISENEPIKVNVYPNPATDMFCIAPSTNDRYQYKLMDLTGRYIAQGQNVTGTVQVDVHHLAPGVYMLFLEQNNRTLTRKVVVR